LIENISIDQIEPYENNPRVHNIEELKKSIQRYGFNVPIVVDKNNIIIAGHARYKAASELGLQEVKVIKATDLTDEQVIEYRIADNKIAELSSWNADDLEQELRSAKDISLVAGFQPHEIARLFPDFSESDYKVYTEEDITKVQQERDEHFQKKNEQTMDDYLTIPCEKCGYEFSVSYRVVKDFY